MNSTVVITTLIYLALTAALGYLGYRQTSSAKDYLLGSFALQFDGVARIARLLVGARLDGRGTDWFEEREKRIRAVTLDDARRVAARLFAASDLLVVAVGKPEGIAARD